MDNHSKNIHLLLKPGNSFSRNAIFLSLKMLSLILKLQKHIKMQ